MKNLNIIKVMLTIGSVLFMVQTYGQHNDFIDGKSVLGKDYVIPEGQYAPSDNGSCLYLVDDGSQENSLGLTLGGDIMWLNYFTATSGCEMINSFSLTWGNMTNGVSCRLILYEDPDDDGNPDDAVYLTETSTTVQNANTNTFTTVNITPTVVSGGFFVAALVPNHASGEYPAPLDETSNAMQSWLAGSDPGTFDINDLSNNTLPVDLNGNYGFPGNWLLRAEGSPAGEVPLSGWSVVIGILLISSFLVIRFRRSIF